MSPRSLLLRDRPPGFAVDDFGLDRDDDGRLVDLPSDAVLLLRSDEADASPVCQWGSSLCWAAHSLSPAVCIKERKDDSIWHLTGTPSIPTNGLLSRGSPDDAMLAACLIDSFDVLANTHAAK